MSALLADDVDFKGLKQNRLWEASSRQGVSEILFNYWFEPSDTIQALVDVAPPTGRISHLRVLCSGFRPRLSPPGVAVRRSADGTRSDA